ncbi:MAG: thiamine pyrophosphate-dependent enzyme [Planctomycetota bacterium]
MSLSLKELSKKEELFVSGHRLCAGCGAGTAIRQIMLATEDPVVIVNATGCLSVSTASYPYTSWKVSWVHSAFENAAATISGIEAAYKSLQRQGKIKEKIKFIVLAGDGGTYDIGLQALSGALERGHSFLYICYNNEAYMNTGIQRSGATPLGAATTTTPAGKLSFGKSDFRKDLTGIIAAHNIPYVAQTTPAHWRDLMTKVKKALALEGPTFINVLAPCQRGWRNEMAISLKLAKLAADSCYWPLYEVENGEWRLNYKPRTKIPVTEWLKPQGRFKHLFTEPKNQEVLERLQASTDLEWERLLKRCVPNNSAEPLTAVEKVS